jgi:hypothetical protein
MNRDWQNDFQHLQDVRNLCKDYNNAIGRRKTEVSGIWSASLFLRSLSAVDAAILLIGSGFYDDAAIITRTLFEIELQLGAIKEQPELAKQLVNRTGAYRLGRLEALVRKGNQMPEGITKEAMMEQIEQIRSADIPPNVKKRQLAVKAGLKYEYETLYSLLSDIAHVSPIGLEHYMTKDPASGIFQAWHTAIQG